MNIANELSHLKNVCSPQLNKPLPKKYEQAGGYHKLRLYEGDETNVYSTHSNEMINPIQILTVRKNKSGDDEYIYKHTIFDGGNAISNIKIDIHCDDKIISDLVKKITITKNKKKMYTIKYYEEFPFTDGSPLILFANESYVINVVFDCDLEIFRNCVFIALHYNSIYYNNTFAVDLLRPSEYYYQFGHNTVIVENEDTKFEHIQNYLENILLFKNNFNDMNYKSLEQFINKNRPGSDINYLIKKFNKIHKYRLYLYEINEIRIHKIDIDDFIDRKLDKILVEIYLNGMCIYDKQYTNIEEVIINQSMMNTNIIKLNNDKFQSSDFLINIISETKLLELTIDYDIKQYE